MAWNKITVGQYIALKEINDRIKELEAKPHTDDLTVEIIEAKCEKLSLIFNKPVSYFERLSFEKFNTSYKMALLIEAEPMPTELNEVITVNGNKYIAFTNPAKFNVHQWYAYLAYQNDIRRNMAKLLTWFYRIEGFDYDKHEPSDYEKDMLDAKMSDVCGCFFLLSKLYAKWQTAVEEKNKELMNKIPDHLDRLEQWAKSQNTMAGSTQ